MDMSSKKTGDCGEALACAYLEQKGLVLLERNYRSGRKEIDLVMRDGETLVFVEVKTRSGVLLGTPAEAVDRRKQKNLILAAEGYLAAHDGFERPARFDVVEVYLDEQRIHWIPNAFTL